MLQGTPSFWVWNGCTCHIFAQSDNIGGSGIQSTLKHPAPEIPGLPKESIHQFAPPHKSLDLNVLSAIRVPTIIELVYQSSLSLKAVWAVWQVRSLG